jgi:acetyltransferase-like isoleucine patch superfamily enzyme
MNEEPRTSPSCNTVPAMGLLDTSTMGFASVGEDVRIYDLLRITGAGRISIGSHVVIDDFVFLQGGEGLSLGSYVHVASFASILGGGIGVIGAFSGVASGARVFTGTDLGDGSGLIGPGVPADFRAVERTRTELGRHVFVGANTVVMAGTTIGEGAVVGAGGVVTHDLEPWTIYVGSPCRPIKDRPSGVILEQARSLGFDDR